MPIAIPLYYYPSQKFIIDDDNCFADCIRIKLQDKHLSVCNSPQKMLDFLLNEYISKDYQPELLKIDADLAGSHTQSHAIIKIDSLQEFITARKSNEISVLIVDFNMPEMTGIEFLKNIQHLPMKKILLTGEDDYKIAVDAFNDGIVNAYIRKGDAELAAKIRQAVSTLEWEYFSDRSYFMKQVNEFDYLYDTHFISAFKQLIADMAITEFYLTDSRGNFYLQDAHGQVTHVIVRNRAQLEQLAGIAIEDDGSAETIQNISEGKVIPFFNDKEEWQVPASEWASYLYPASEIAGNPDKVWAIINK